MAISLQETRLATEVGSVRELNLYLAQGWVLIQTYVRHAHDTQSARFVLAWQKDEDPVRPELLDEWEQKELFRSMER